jgi:parallel beta helix pectate lyase-like protein
MRRKKDHLLAALALWLAAAVPGGALAAERYVDGNGAAADDSGPGTSERPWKTIGRAARDAQPGDVVSIRTGVYRERVVIERSGTAEKPICFRPDTAARVIISGADVIGGWRKEEVTGPGTGQPGQKEGNNLFSADWPHRFIDWSPQHTHPDDPAHRVIGRAEQVMVQGYLLQQVLRRDKLTRGTFFADLDERRLYAWSADDRDLADPATIVEASVREVLWDSRGDHVITRGLCFRHAANRAQAGAARFSGAHDVVEDCTFERTNSIGAAFLGPDIVVRRSTFQDNGQMGFGAGHAHRLLFTGCLVRNNNLKNFDRGWEAGGNKLALSRGVVIEKSRFLENRGNGIWFDIGNEDSTVRECLIADNEDAGIFYEISYGLHAHDNVIVGNGLADTPGSWGAGAGIAISSSPGCVIERNLIAGNREGFNFREQLRTTPTIDDRKGRAVWNHDQVIRGNLLACNRDAQLGGWFDVDDERHWPRAGQTGKRSDLCLESLHLTLEKNLYSVLPGQVLFRWGVPWKRHKKYATLDEVRRDLGLEQGSLSEPVLFEDAPARDFRVRAESPAARLECYPRGPVPGTTLGIIPEAEPRK